MSSCLKSEACWGSNSLFVLVFVSFLPFGLGCLLDFLLLLFFAVVLDDVEEVVDGPVPLLPGLVDRVLELNGGLLFAHVKEEGALHKADRLLVQLVETRHQHQNQQVDEDVRVLANLEERLARQLLEDLFKVFRVVSVLLALVLSLLVVALLRVERKLVVFEHLLLHGGVDFVRGHHIAGCLLVHR